MAEEIFLGVDIGGTKVAAGLVDSRGKILSKTRTPMKADGSAEEAFAAVRVAIDSTRKTNPDATVRAIGVSSPGPLDPRRGVVINPPNLPCWRNFPLAQEIERSYGLVARVDNDANAAGLAEALWGAGVGFRNVFYATIGTGIGTGIAFNGRVYHGRTGAAAEGGHVSIDYRGPRCGCGKRGCIEVLASGPAIAARAREKLKTAGGRGARLLELAKGNPAAVTGEMIGEAWHGGDALAGEVLRETADLLAIWLGNIIDLLEPDVIVIGGGVGELVSEWFDHIRKQLPSWSINQRCQEILLRPAHYGADAGIAGAAALCLSARDERSGEAVAR